ncbi:ADGRL2 [Branchiostoma lanceolatum]|uniref:ADGRL2 protein n=1 Tax=Branchiostoma lanceolatum TaxID=7740 RepID=A0A8K0EU08_BRALA|nr:ADGRL2 [Branchiostoma lanceolatum]
MATTDRCVWFLLYVCLLVKDQGVKGLGGNNNSSECRWKLADHGQYLYRRTSQIHWPDQDWPVVSPETCWGWSCFITSQKFLQDGQWKDLSSLGDGVADNAFTIAHEENGRAQHCRRQWFIQWEVTSDITRLDGMDIYVDVTCTLSFLGAMHTKTNCLTLRTTEKLIAETLETSHDVTITSTAQPQLSHTSHPNGGPECEWTFADDRQHLYRRTSPVRWSYTDWPTSHVTKQKISPTFCGPWTCSVTTQRFLDHGGWKSLTSLGRDVAGDIFGIGYKDTINKGNCTRHWFLKWNYTTAVSRLGPLVFQLGVTCTSVGQHTATDCITFRTEGTHHQPSTTTAKTTAIPSTLRSSNEYDKADVGRQYLSEDHSVYSNNKRINFREEYIKAYYFDNNNNSKVYFGQQALAAILERSLRPFDPTLGALTALTALSRRSHGAHRARSALSWRSFFDCHPRRSHGEGFEHVQNHRRGDGAHGALAALSALSRRSRRAVGALTALSPRCTLTTYTSISGQATTSTVPITTTDVPNCSSDGTCQGQSNVSNNTSPWVRELQTSLKQSVSPGEAISMVLNQLRKFTILLSGDIIEIVRMLSMLVEIQERQLQNVPQEERKGIATDFTQAMVQCGSIVLKDKYRQAWNDVPSGAKPKLAASLSDSLEKAGLLLAKTVPSETFSISEENVVMDIVPPSTVNATYPDLTKVDSSCQWSEVIDRITLPPVDKQVVVALYNTLGDYYNTRPEKTIVNSRVISATLVNNSSAETVLGGNVTITLGHTRQNETVDLSTSSCSFWDQSIANWSTEGCTAKESDDGHTVCECNHLTNFAILVDVIGHEDEFALHVITYIGCIISIFCLLFCIFAFVGSRRVRCPRTIILANMCVCLLVAEVVFLAAVDKTQNKVVCTAIAIALHYLFLTVFAWMCVEGIELYVMLVKIFNLKGSRMLYYYLIGYGTPGVVVATSVTVNYLMELDGYGTEKYCWLAVKNYFIFSFVGPMLFVILVNIGFLIMTLKIIHTKRSTRKSKETRGKKIRHWVRVSLSLIFVLGVTWALGVLYIVKETVFFAYVFAIINSLQGLFILIFHCLLNEKVQDEMRRSIKRSVKRESLQSTGSMTTFRRTLGSFSSTSLHAWKTPPSTMATSYPRTLQECNFQSHAIERPSSTLDAVIIGAENAVKTTTKT